MVLEGRPFAGAGVLASPLPLYLGEGATPPLWGPFTCLQKASHTPGGTSTPGVEVERSARTGHVEWEGG